MERKIKEVKNRMGSKFWKSIAFSEAFMFILSSLAFAFIVGGMGLLSLGGVSGKLNQEGINYYNSLGYNVYESNKVASFYYFVKKSDNSVHILSKDGLIAAPTSIDASQVDKNAHLAVGEDVDIVFAGDAPSGGQSEQIADTTAISTNNILTPDFFENPNLNTATDSDVLASTPTTGGPLGTGSTTRREIITPIASQAHQIGNDLFKDVPTKGITALENNINSKLPKFSDFTSDPTRYTRTDYDGYTSFYDKMTKETTVFDKETRQLVSSEKAGEVEYKTAFGTHTPDTWYGHLGYNLLEGVQWAAIAYSITETLTKILGSGMSSDTKNMITAAGYGLTAGILAGKTTYGIYSAFSKASDSKGWVDSSGKVHKAGSVGQTGTLVSWGIGIAVAYWVFAENYKKTKTRTMTMNFKCYAWQAPRGGEDCSKCNDNILKPCSEYRCKALGATCKVINAGTSFIRCIDGSAKDVTSPGIKEWKDALTLGYSYSDVKRRPAGGGSSSSSDKSTSGMKITNPESTDGCLKAYTPFTFGIITTEEDDSGQPSQCKIDYKHTTKYDDMEYYMDGNNLYIENHTQTMSLPGTEALNQIIYESNNSLAIKNDGEYTLYIRCKDGNGNTNADEFAVRFCVDKSPDLTPPIIKSTSIPSESYVLYKVDNVSISVYVSEPSECRWDRKDASYTNMNNQMTCNNEIWEMNADYLYTCTTTLTGIKDRQENQFYFRCQDKSKQNNTMSESYSYVLHGSQPLTILSTAPNGTVSGSSSTVVTTLEVATDNGANNGEARCSYSLTNNDENFVEMFETGSNKHKQDLDLSAGSYNYYFNCVDAGGNSAKNSTSFKVEVDKTSPIVARAYSYEGKLVIATDEESSCKYSTSSCNFNMDNEGLDMPYAGEVIHYAEWKTTQNYYIKCSDEYGNQPDSNQCSIVVRPYELVNPEAAY